MSGSNYGGLTTTAFVFAGGGSFGAIQVGMMHSLASHGVAADMVVGSSVGALNGAYYAGDPTLKGVLQLETIWRGLQRHDVFPVNWWTLLGFLLRRDFLIPHDGIRKLIDDHLPYRNLQDAKLPVHIVTTDIISGDSVVLSEGSAAEAIIASTADSRCVRPDPLQGLLPRRRCDLEQHADQGRCRHGRATAGDPAHRVRLLATHMPPTGAVANALHALTLLIARQLVGELEDLAPDIEYFVVPPLCPLVGSPYDFSRTADHIERAIRSTDQLAGAGWPGEGGDPR